MESVFDFWRDVSQNGRDRALKMGKYGKPTENIARATGWTPLAYTKTKQTNFTKMVPFFNFTFILFLTLVKASLALYIEQLASNYPDLLLEMQDICCPVKKFYFVF